MNVSEVREQFVSLLKERKAFLDKNQAQFDVLPLVVLKKEEDYGQEIYIMALDSRSRESVSACAVITQDRADGKKQAGIYSARVYKDVDHNEADWIEGVTIEVAREFVRKKLEEKGALFE